MKTDLFLYFYYGCARIKAKIYSSLTKIRFKSIGKNLKLFGVSSMMIGDGLSVGDNCWIHAVTSYKGVSYNPALTIGNDVSMSDAVHVSCIQRVFIGAGTLIGSCVYIGDHSHGPTKPTTIDLSIPPALRPLADPGDIYIGDNVWIGDGVVVLAGSYIPSGSIVGANSVVNSKIPVAGMIAGTPAATKRVF